MRVCTIDIGTNSVRALVADVDRAGHTRVVHREGHITRLGEELSGRGLLSGRAIDRTAGRVTAIVATARGMGAERFEIVATSAARNAVNADELKDRIRNLASLETEIITGLEEANYICKGALNSLDVAGKRAILADIGGGSTELIFAHENEDPVLSSVCAGAVYLTERFIRHDPPLDEELSAAHEHASSTLRKALAGLPSGAEELIGLGGTITTIPPIIMQMESYDPSRVHNYTITIEQVISVLERLATMRFAERKKVRGLEKGREDVIVGGLLIVKALLEASGFEKVRVSDRGILFGLALSIAEEVSSEGQMPAGDDPSV